MEKLAEILKRGANPNSLHQWLDFAAAWGNEGDSKFPPLQLVAAKNNAPEAALLLLSFGAQLTITDPFTGNSVLHTAIALKNEPYALFLIDRINHSEDIATKQLLDQKDIKEDWQNSPLILSFKKGLRETIEALLRVGADGAMADRFGTAPLHWAALLRYDHIIEQLLAHEIDPGQPNKFGHTPLELYQYELGPLDYKFKLRYDPSGKTASVGFTTNLPEISEHRFHGFYREQNPINPHIVKQLTTEHRLALSLEQQYLNNFIEQDAIARSAKWVTGWGGYWDQILTVLRTEGERYYGYNADLPEYAPETNQVTFGDVRRKKIPELQTTRGQITQAISLHANPKQSQDEDYRPQVVKAKPVVETTMPVYKSAKNILFPAKSANVSSSSIPVELAKLLRDSGMLNDCVKLEFISINQLVELYQNKPYVVDALRCSNIYHGIRNKNITITQLSELSEEQVTAIKHKFQGETLQAKVAEYLEQNKHLGPRYE